MMAIDDHLLFAADDGVPGLELWRSDGTSGGTALLFDLLPGPEPGAAPIALENGGIAAAGDHVFFRGHDDQAGLSLWGFERSTLAETSAAPATPPDACACTSARAAGTRSPLGALALAALLLLRRRRVALCLALLTAGCSDTPPRCRSPIVEIAPKVLAAAGTRIEIPYAVSYPLDAVGGECDALVPAVGMTMGPPGAQADAREDALSFLAASPGDHAVYLTHPDDPKKHLATVRITAFEATEPVPIASFHPVDVDCRDAAVSEGRYYCVKDGVSVHDLETGALLARTEEEVPRFHGVAARGGLLATASVECSAGLSPDSPIACPGDASWSGGLRLYRWDGALRLVSQPTMVRAHQVTIDGDTLYVAESDRLLVFDVADPSAPRQIGCARSVGAGKVVVRGAELISIGGAIEVYARASLAGPDCAEPLETRAAGSSLPTGLAAVQGSRVIVAGSSGLALVDLDPASTSGVGGFDIVALGGGVLRGDRVYAAANGNLVGFDVSNTGAPKPVAFHADGAYIFTRVVPDGDRIHLERRLRATAPRG